MELGQPQLQPESGKDVFRLITSLH